MKLSRRQQRVCDSAHLRRAGLGSGKTCADERPSRRIQTRNGRTQAVSDPCAETQGTTLSGPSSSVDWDDLGFSIANVGPEMFVAEHTEEQGWVSGGLRPYGPLAMDPAAQVLNYGQSIFEGMKALRTSSGNIVLFRPRDNAARMREGAARMSMVPPDEELFLQAVVSTVRANSHMVPPVGKGSLYLRPLLLGTGAIVGLGPAPGFTFTCFGTAVGAYFKGGQMDPIDLLVETNFHRSAPGGMGGTKCAGNYSPVLVTQLQAKRDGFADVLYLDAKTNTCLEEVSSCNIFVLKGKTVKTPPLNGTILPGVTRRSVITLLAEAGYTVEEVAVPIEEACVADEVFTTGTAVVVASVGSLTYEGQRYQLGTGLPGQVTQQVYDELTGIQQQNLEDKHGWVYVV